MTSLEAFAKVKEPKKTLIHAYVLHEDPICGGYEVREAFFTSRNEAFEWGKRICAFYKEHNIKYEYYDTVVEADIRR